MPQESLKQQLGTLATGETETLAPVDRQYFESLYHGLGCAFMFGDVCMEEWLSLPWDQKPRNEFDCQRPEKHRPETFVLGASEAKIFEHYKSLINTDTTRTNKDGTYREDIHNITHDLHPDGASLQHGKQACCSIA